MREIIENYIALLKAEPKPQTEESKYNKIYKEDWSLSNWSKFSHYSKGIPVFKKLTTSPARSTDKVKRVWRMGILIVTEDFYEYIEPIDDYRYGNTRAVTITKDPINLTTLDENGIEEDSIMIDLRKSVEDNKEVVAILTANGYQPTPEEALNDPTFGAKALLSNLDNKINKLQAELIVLSK